MAEENKKKALRFTGRRIETSEFLMHMGDFAPPPPPPPPKKKKHLSLYK